ncbi:PRC-barrel domain-containing protein [Phaeovibrio sulfidiphilus]|uniref:PRC-barrel domain-containing protein n=1 Tax=Phaeovibrio sulfidiphilus TaxID=1220600 RepID=A0A8J7CC87_9PROT|nr:PRC-barrel domain-containing protein [Phaeovibrio sulfidiphilus]
MKTLSLCLLAAALFMGPIPRDACADPLAEPDGVGFSGEQAQFSWPVSASDLLNLPVRIYGGAPPVSVVDDLLLKADGRVVRVIIDNGQFLRMGLDGKRVALPYEGAIVPGADGEPAFLRINIAASYGEVIREFRYELMSPTDYSMKAILGAPVSTSDMPGAGSLHTLWVSEAGTVEYADVDLSVLPGQLSKRVRIPFTDLRLSRLGPMDETRAFVDYPLLDLRTMSEAVGAPTSPDTP